MAKKNKNLTKLAKNDKKKTNKAKSSEPKDVNTKAKETVKKLLDDVSLQPNKTENLIELDENPKNIKWLEEQVSILTETNEKLTKENEDLKTDYKKIFEKLQQVNGDFSDENVKMIPDSEIKNDAIGLFEEVQNNYLGFNETRTRYSQIKLIHLLHKMIGVFPFLSDRKKF